MNQDEPIDKFLTGIAVQASRNPNMRMIVAFQTEHGVAIASNSGDMTWQFGIIKTAALLVKMRFKQMQAVFEQASIGKADEMAADAAAANKDPKIVPVQ